MIFANLQLDTSYSQNPKQSWLSLCGYHKGQSSKKCILSKKVKKGILNVLDTVHLLESFDKDSKNRFLNEGMERRRSDYGIYDINNDFTFVDTAMQYFAPLLTGKELALLQFLSLLAFFN